MMNCIIHTQMHTERTFLYGKSNFDYIGKIKVREREMNRTWSQAITNWFTQTHICFKNKMYKKDAMMEGGQIRKDVKVFYVYQTYGVCVHPLCVTNVVSGKYSIGVSSTGLR